jgi:hypothetical protein
VWTPTPCGAARSDSLREKTGLLDSMLRMWVSFSSARPTGGTVR